MEVENISDAVASILRAINGSASAAPPVSGVIDGGGSAKIMH
jgi:hypothetical protein